MIKKFKSFVNESGLSSDVKHLSVSSKKLKEEIFEIGLSFVDRLPSVTYGVVDTEYKEIERYLFPSITTNISKYGTIYDIQFILSSPSGKGAQISDMIDKISNIHNDIYDILSEYSYPNELRITKYKLFGNKIVGQKDGNNIEDITDKIEQMVDDLRDKDLISNFQPLYIQFLITGK